MARRSLLTSLTAACVGAVLLLWGALSYASDVHATGGNDRPVASTTQPAPAHSQNEIIRAFTRELAFIRTFAVEAPAQYEQKNQSVGGLSSPGKTGSSVSEEEIKPREYRSDLKTNMKDASPAKTGKNTRGRKK